MRTGTVHSLALVAFLLLSCLDCSSPGAAPPQPGPWRAWLTSPGGELPFGMELEQQDGVWTAYLINGTERIEIERTEVDGDSVAFHIDHYDSSITASLSENGSRMEGMWRKTSGPNEESSLPFHATAGESRRFRAETPAQDAVDVTGHWATNFATDDIPAVGIFESAGDDTVHATFLTATGDYRFLAGNVDGDHLRLSVFDGAHAFLFDARMRDDGTLEGDFWSRDSWHEGWTAARDSEAALPDAFDQTTWIDGADLASVVYPDLDGNPRSLADPAFAGAAKILVVFGSWCPNCNDATDFMVELDGRYRDRGLSIVGLGFEMTGDFDRDAEQLRTYAAYHGIGYPLLVAGLSDKDAASRAFPLIDRIRSFPTTLFLHSDGSVRAVHSGYTGPATGPAYDELRAKFTSLIEELLEESNRGT